MPRKAAQSTARVTLSERLLLLRTQAGLTQKQLAALSGIPHNSISRIELGKTPDITTRTLIALAGALGVTTDYLLGLSETATPPCATTPTTG